jgi:hypothetical protein
MLPRPRLVLLAALAGSLALPAAWGSEPGGPAVYGIGAFSSAAGCTGYYDLLIAGDQDGTAAVYVTITVLRTGTPTTCTRLGGAYSVSGLLHGAAGGCLTDGASHLATLCLGQGAPLSDGYAYGAWLNASGLPPLDGFADFHERAL